MFLVFTDQGVGCHKWYAKTPAGEYAFSDGQGLYEWRHGQRIDHSGGDQQGSDKSGPWTRGGPHNQEFLDSPRGKGMIESLKRVRLN